jgi:hypothetical protein
MTLDLTDDEKLALVQLLQRAIEEDPYFLVPGSTRSNRSWRSSNHGRRNPNPSPLSMNEPTIF